MKGFFFGSFDPPHVGHINVVTTALNSGIVDKVEVIPAFKSVWKNTETRWEYRLMTCKSSFNSIPGVSVNPVEYILANENPLPTYKVIDYLKETEKDNFVIIMTPETFDELPRWIEGDRILEENEFIIVNSRHFGDNRDELFDPKGNTVIFSPDIQICSTRIREKIKNGKLVEPFVTEEVSTLIRMLKLYK